MKKIFLTSPLLLLFLLSPSSAHAGLSESCFPAVQCNAGDDYYGNNCQSHVESLNTTMPSCQSLNGAPGAGKQWAFDCNNGCYQTSIPTPNLCPGGVMVSGSCLARLDVLNDNVHLTNKAYKIYNGTSLTEVVHVNTAGCADGEVAVSDTASPTGWSCAAQSGLWQANGLDIYYNSGKVGIGTNSPSAAFDVEVSAGGAATIGSASNSATGDYAIAIGRNNTATGYSSMAMGSYTEASEDYATAMGYDTLANGPASVATGQSSTASGSASTAMGQFTVASGQVSVAMGSSSVASGTSALAMGSSTTASGINSLALGSLTLASGPFSTAMGTSTIASGISATAMGNSTNATGSYSTALGNSTTSQAFGSLVIGRHNVIVGTTNVWVLSDPLFVIGNGTSDVSPSNAFTVLKNGKVGIGTSSPVATLDVDLTSGAAATIGSSTNSATGLYSIALGNNTLSSADSSLATGSYSIASGVASVAMGSNTIASGDHAVAMGNSSMAQAYGSVALGRYNVISGNSTSWVSTDPLLVVGNGTSIGSTSNALTLLKNGNLTIAGTASKPGGGSWSVSSDIRLKTLKGDYKKGLAEITSLNPVMFRYKNDNPKNLPSDVDQVGFVAQEIQKIFPEAVEADADGYLDFNMHPVNVAVINAIQELKKENDQLKKALCDLKPVAELCY